MYSLCLLNESRNIRKKGPVHSDPFVNAYKLVSLPLSKLHSSVKGRGGGRDCKGGPRRGKSSGKRKNITKNRTE